MKIIFLALAIFVGMTLYAEKIKEINYVGLKEPMNGAGINLKAMKL